MRYLIAGLLAAGSLLASAHAAVIVETTDFTTSGTNVGSLDSGLNTISGSLSGNCVPGDCNGIGAGDTQDNFIFVVPAGFQITSVVAEILSAQGPNGLTITAFSANDVTPPTLGLNFGSTLPAGGVSANLVASLFGPGSYLVSFFGQSADASGAFTANYRLSVTLAPVSDVPLPAALPLFATGLAGFAAARRRRSA